MLRKCVLEPGAYVFNEFERFLLDERKSITIALVGKTGVGKSRLVNALIGNKQRGEKFFFQKQRKSQLSKQKNMELKLRSGIRTE